MRVDTALWVRLGRKFARTRAARRSGLGLAVLCALLMLVFVAVQAFTLTQQQRADRDLGAFQYSVGLGGIPITDDDTLVADAAAAAVAAGAGDVTVVLETYDVQPSDAAGSLVMYREAPWSDEIFPARYVLEGGRWPSAPGEVVVSSPLAQFVDGDRLNVLSGTTSLQVVGTVTDRYATNLGLVLAAPGTWVGLDWATISARQPSVAAAGTLLWNDLDPAAVVSAVEPAVLAVTDPAGTPWVRPDEAQALLSSGLTSRADILAAPNLGTLDLYPIAFQIPSLLLPALAALVVLGVNTRQVRRTVGVLRAIGMRSRDASIGRLGGIVVLLVASAVAGAAAGAVLGVPLRLLLGQVSTQPLSPYPDVLPPAGRLVAATVVAAGAGVVAFMLATRAASARALLQLLPSARALSFTRQLAAAVVTVAIVWQAASMRVLFDAIAVTVTSTVLVLLLAPAIVRRAIAAVVPTRGPSWRLAQRQLHHDPTRALVAAALVAATLGPAISILVVVQSSLVQSAELRTPVVPADQVLLSSDNQITPPPDAVIAAATAIAGPGAGVVPLQAAADPSAVVTTEPDTIGVVWALETAEQAQQLCSGALSAEQLETLTAGGVLRLAGPATNPQPLWRTDLVSGQSTATPPLETVAADCGPSWNYTTSALLLTSTLRAHELPVSPSNVVLTGIDATTAQQIQAEVIAQGYDSSYVQTFQPPRADPLPIDVLLILLGIWAFGAVAVVVSTAAQTRVLRRYGASLTALGIPPSWIRVTLLRQIIVTILLGLGLAAIAAAIPIAIAALRVPNASITVPWSLVAALVAGTVLLGTITFALCARRLTPRERTTGGR